MKATESERAMLDRLQKNAEKELKEWRMKLEQAQQQVDYWKNQVNAACTLSTKALLDSWDKKDDK